MKKNADYSEKYFELLKKFNLTPDFKLTDYEKVVVKFVDKQGTVTVFALADAYDLRPSEVKELVEDLVGKGALKEEEGNISLTDAAIRYIHAPKEARKTEKKFRKFLNTLDEKDLDRLSDLVNSFKVKEQAEPAEQKEEE